MRRILAITSVLFIVSCKTTKNANFFRNKYLVYTKEIKENDSLFNNGFFIANINDTIFEINHPFGSRIRGSLPLASYPYKLINKKNGIHYVFFGNYNAWPNSSNEDIDVWRYPYSVNDTCKVMKGGELTEKFTYSNFYYSYYSGKDTTLIIGNKEFKCRIFIEEVPSLGDRIFNRKYIDSKTFMPIKVNTWINGSNRFGSPKSENYVLRYWLDKDQIKSKEFRVMFQGR